jgi:hypothetical protein
VSLAEVWREALALPQRAAQASWPRRIAAAAIFLAAAGLVWWAMHLPLAVPVEDEPAAGWTVLSGDEITLVGPQTPSLLTYQSPVGKGVTLGLDQASLTPDTVAGLTELGLKPPAGPVPVRWITHDGGGGRAMITLNLRPTGPHPALVVRLNSGAGITGLTFLGQDASLEVSISAALADPAPGASVASAPDAQVGLGDQSFLVTAGAFPLDLEVPAGSPVNLSYAPGGPDTSVFRWGVRAQADQHFSSLPLAAVRLRRQNEADRQDACGAPAGAFVAWRGGAVSQLNCAPTLLLRGLDLSQTGEKVQVSGLGYAAQNGQARVFSFDELGKNPLLSGLAGAGFTALVGWTIHIVLGTPKRAAKPGGKPRGKARRKPGAGGG